MMLYSRPTQMIEAAAGSCQNVSYYHDITPVSPEEGENRICNIMGYYKASNAPL